MTRHETNPPSSPEVSAFEGLLQFPHTLTLRRDYLPKKTAPVVRDANRSVPPGESMTSTRPPRPRVGERENPINDEARAA